MAKKGIYLKDLNSIIKSNYSKSGWALCIGAGTSRPVVPDWNSLVEALVARDTTVRDPLSISKRLLERYNQDALIQAAKDRLSLSDKEFADLLAEIIYGDIKKETTPEEWKSFNLILEVQSPHLEKDNVWHDFIKVRERVLKKTSAYQLAEVLMETYSVIRPEAILSFNAESLLYAILHSFEREKYLGKVKSNGEMKTILDRVTHSISSRSRDCIPYIFCHGTTSLPLIKKRSPLLKAHDKLVFSEASYLELANVSFSWQSASFISYCMKSSIVFAGVSLTDSNMRRWLSWIHMNKVRECEANGLVKDYGADYTEHYWINVKPKDVDEELWIESTVAHLGVRLIWIDDWDEVGTALRTLLIGTN